MPNTKEIASRTATMAESRLLSCMRITDLVMLRKVIVPLASSPSSSRSSDSYRRMERWAVSIASLHWSLTLTSPVCVKSDWKMTPIRATSVFALLVPHSLRLGLIWLKINELLWWRHITKYRNLHRCNRARWEDENENIYYRHDTNHGDFQDVALYQLCPTRARSSIRRTFAVMTTRGKVQYVAPIRLPLARGWNLVY